MFREKLDFRDTLNLNVQTGSNSGSYRFLKFGSGSGLKPATGTATLPGLGGGPTAVTSSLNWDKLTG